MTHLLTPEEALRLVPDWNASEASIEALAGGLTNRTFHVRYRGRQFVLRLNSIYSETFAFDRALERQIMQHAHAAGLAPKVIFAADEAGVLLREHVTGQAWTSSDMHSDANLERLADLLRAVHALPLSGQPMDITGAASTYAANLEQYSDLRPFARRCVQIVAAAPDSDSVICSHNDIVAGNVIEGEQLALIDWEYACDNNAMYDLASAIGYHDLDRRAADTLRQAYTGSNAAIWQEHLDEELRVFDAIQWLWLANRQVIAPKQAQSTRLQLLKKRVLQGVAFRG